LQYLTLLLFVKDNFELDINQIQQKLQPIIQHYTDLYNQSNDREIKQFAQIILTNINTQFGEIQNQTILTTQISNRKSFKLYFVRHGFSCANMYNELAKRKTFGLVSTEKTLQTTIQDPNLTDYGLISSKYVGNTFCISNIHKFFVSPLIRTWETALGFLHNAQESITLQVAPFTKEQSGDFSKTVGRNRDNYPYDFATNVDRFTRVKSLIAKNNVMYRLNNLDNVNVQTMDGSGVYSNDYYKEGNLLEFISYINKYINDNENVMLFGHSHVLQHILKQVKKEKIFPQVFINGAVYTPQELSEFLDNKKKNVLNNNTYVWEFEIENGEITTINLVNNGIVKPSPEQINEFQDKNILCETLEQTLGQTQMGYQIEQQINNMILQQNPELILNIILTKLNNLLNELQELFDGNNVIYQQNKLNEFGELFNKYRLYTDILNISNNDFKQKVVDFFRKNNNKMLNLLNYENSTIYNVQFLMSYNESQRIYVTTILQKVQYENNFQYNLQYFIDNNANKFNDSNYSSIFTYEKEFDINTFLQNIDINNLQNELLTNLQAPVCSDNGLVVQSNQLPVRINSGNMERTQT